MWLVPFVALAGYGDPVDGVPNPDGRRVHLWTDAARVAPADFDADYALGGCSFASFPAADQTADAPLRQHDGLVGAAAAHTDDMLVNNFFDHDSSDGTVWSDRVWAVYPGFGIAENISSGRSSARAAVLSGWMCSAGHRTNIKNGAYTDFGGAWAPNKGTEDFGYGVGGATPPIRVMAHEVAGNAVTVRASWGSTTPPDAFTVVVDGVPVPMALAHGTATQGIYAVELADDGACHEAYIQATLAGQVHTYPEEGSYGWGPCLWDDADAQWLDGQIPPSAPPSLSSELWTVGQPVTLTVTDAPPGAAVHFAFGTSEGPGPCPAAMLGACLGVRGSTRHLGGTTADLSGEASLTMSVPAAAAGRDLALQAVVVDGNDVTLTAVVWVSVP